MTLKAKIFFNLLFIVATVNGQVSYTVNIDASSKDVAVLFSQKKFDAALSLVNKLISNTPSDGINYFNRAVIRYYKNPKPVRIYVQDGKKIIEPWYDTLVINDCKRAQKRGYNNSELYYQVFLQYYNYNPDKWSQYPIQDDAFDHKYISYVEQKELIDSAIKIKSWDNKYISARFQLYINHEIVSTYFDIYKGDSITIGSDCEKILFFSKDKKIRFFAFYYLSTINLVYHADTLKAIKYLSRAIDINPFNVQNTSNRKFNNAYDNLYAERGNLKYLRRDFEGAIEDFNTHLSRWDDIDIYYTRALSYSLINNAPNALRDINKAILLNEEKRNRFLKSVGQLDNAFLSVVESELGNAYFLRGIINLDLLHNKKAALRDVTKASEYGHKDAVALRDELLSDTEPIEDNSQATEILNLDNSIPMIKKDGVYEIPITINNTLKINFIFDAGASIVSISADVALTLIRTGTITDKDFIGTQTYKFADGSTAKSKVFLLKELQIGTRKVTNIKATISNSLDAPLLLGQSALNKFGKITIDYKNGVIHFED